MKFLKYDIDYNNLPEHIAIIMDGNGRYATAKGLSRTEGHKKGADVLYKLSRFAGEIGIKYLTVYAFSTENWKRPYEEVQGIMKLLAYYLSKWEFYLGDNDARIRVIGDISDFDKTLQKAIRFVENKTKDRKGLCINIALGYGGRNEIVSAVKKIADRCINNEISVEDIDEKLVSDSLYTYYMPDPELVIRPGGEKRISNFLLWQCAYSEFVWMDILWPEFTNENLLEAISIYQSRNRRFGGV